MSRTQSLRLVTAGCKSGLGRETIKHGHQPLPSFQLAFLRSSRFVTPSVSTFPRRHSYSKLTSSMETLQHMASQAKGAVKDTAEHVSMQLLLRRESLFDMKDRVALVTGGGSGIGLMIARTLAMNGAKVYITGRTAEKLDTVVSTFGKDIPGQLIPVTCDITNKQSIAELHDFIASREHCLCILVNNAGISTGHVDIGGQRTADQLKAAMFDNADSSFEAWCDDYRTNTGSVYFVTGAFLPMLQRSTERFKGWSGTVINIASISGQVKTAQKHFSYNASKAATIHLSRMMASEVAAAGLKVRINSISPGVFPSEMTKGESGGDQRSELPAEKGGSFPSGRPGKDEEMASTVLFCAANQYLNGQDITVDGGATLTMGR